MRAKAIGGYARAAALSPARRVEIAKAAAVSRWSGVKPPRVPALTEDQLHKQVAGFLAAGLPRDVVWTTFPAGGGGKVRGAQLKARGLRAGWPDIQIFGAGKLVLIELKTAKGVVDPEQVECHAALTKAGALVFVCRSLDDVQRALVAARVPFRADAFGLGWVRAA